MLLLFLRAPSRIKVVEPFFASLRGSKAVRCSSWPFADWPGFARGHPGSGKRQRTL